MTEESTNFQFKAGERVDLIDVNGDVLHNLVVVSTCYGYGDEPLGLRFHRGGDSGILTVYTKNNLYCKVVPHV